MPGCILQHNEPTTNLAGCAKLDPVSEQLSPRRSATTPCISVREASRCGGKGWLLYDQTFYQQVAVWATVNRLVKSEQLPLVESVWEDMHPLHGDRLYDEWMIRTLAICPPTHTGTHGYPSWWQREQGRGSKICSSWNDDGTILPLSSHVPSAGPILTKWCIALPTLLPANF
jgi:hypothetical protein